MRVLALLALFLLADFGPGQEQGPASRPALAQVAAPEVKGFIYLRHETFSCGGQTHTVPIYCHEKTGLEFVLVPGGEFKMGSSAGKESRLRYDEKPQHRVRVKPFLFCRTEVTKAVWGRLVNTKASNWKGSNPNHPVEQVSWDAAQQWCKVAGLRLPTEAEWEYACRAGTTSRFCFGYDDGELSNYAWCNGPQTGPVAQKRPNAFGLFDMHGNVYEWCEDNWHADYNGAPTDGRAWLGGSSHRVIRGGSWFGNAKVLSSTHREARPPDSCDYMGFRPACSLPSDQPSSRATERLPASRPASMPVTPDSVPGFSLLREATFSCGGQTHTVPIYRHELRRLSGCPCQAPPVANPDLLTYPLPTPCRPVPSQPEIRAVALRQSAVDLGFVAI